MIRAGLARVRLELASLPPWYEGFWPGDIRHYSHMDISKAVQPPRLRVALLGVADGLVFGVSGYWA